MDYTDLSLLMSFADFLNALSRKYSMVLYNNGKSLYFIDMSVYSFCNKYELSIHSTIKVSVGHHLIDRYFSLNSRWDVKSDLTF